MLDITNSNSANATLDTTGSAKDDGQTKHEEHCDGSSWSDDFGMDNAKTLWEGQDGLCVMTFGVAIPAFLILLAILFASKRVTLVILEHPLESLAEILLVLSIPLTFNTVWSALCRKKYMFTLRRGVALGAAIGTSAVVAVVCATAVFTAGKCLAPEIGTSLTTGLCFLAALSGLAASCGAYLACRVWRSLDFSISRKRAAISTITGAVLAVITFICAEARPFCIRIAEHMTISNSARERQAGMAWLRKLDAEHELRMECSDARAAGLPGLFIPVKANTLHQLYFAVTGKPFSFHDGNNTDLSSLPDEYLSRNVVGDKVPGLALVRSSLTGFIHGETLTSTVNWTLVLKNDSAQALEARAEFAVPPGAAVTGLTIWSDGQPREATVAASERVEGIYQWVDRYQPSPATLTNLGKGRVLLHCFPVDQEDELKVNISMVLPATPVNDKTADLALPHLIAANFDLSGENQFRIRSDAPATTALHGIHSSRGHDAMTLLEGNLNEQQLTSTDFLLGIERPQFKPFAVEDEIANHKIGLYIRENIQRTPTKPPKHLVVVVDGSTTLKEHASEITKALSQIPLNIPVSVIIASQDQPEHMQPVSILQGLRDITDLSFTGGQDNLQAVVKGAELAGESKNGALLWIHGPQPSLNKEIYIMAPFESTPKFYEMSIDSSSIDTPEYFKNHSEIGPFVSVVRKSGITADLQSFFAKWERGSSDYQVTFEDTATADDLPLVSGQAAHEVMALKANAECSNLLSKRQTQTAARTAMAYNLVTPVSTAVVPAAQYPNNDEKIQDGPKDADAPMQGVASIRGASTAGTIRVNNLANLESLFCIVANFVEITGFIIGLTLLLQGIIGKASSKDWFGLPFELTRGKRLATGFSLLFFALAFPGLLNWFVASARDANLFY